MSPVTTPRTSPERGVDPQRFAAGPHPSPFLPSDLR
jgi:hypothetical protein